MLTGELDQSLCTKVDASKSCMQSRFITMHSDGNRKSLSGGNKHNSEDQDFKAPRPGAGTVPAPELEQHERFSHVRDKTGYTTYTGSGVAERSVDKIIGVVLLEWSFHFDLDLSRSVYINPFAHCHLPTEL